MLHCNNTARNQAAQDHGRSSCSDCSCTSSGKKISLNGFGKFKVKDSPAREGRNPATGATIQIAASKKLTFSPAKAIKDQLNG